MTSDELNKLYHVHVKGLCPHENTEIIRSQEICLDCDALPNDVIIPRYAKDPAVFKEAVMRLIDNNYLIARMPYEGNYKFGLGSRWSEDPNPQHAAMKAVLKMIKPDLEL